MSADFEPTWEEDEEESFSDGANMQNIEEDQETHDIVEHFTDLQALNSIFSDFTRKDFTQLAQVVQMLHVSVGDKVIEKGAEASFVGIIFSGVLSVMKDGMEIAKMERGVMFGEQGYFQRGFRAADVVAAKEAQIGILQYHYIKEGGLHSTVRLKFLHSLGQQLTKMFRMRLSSDSHQKSQAADTVMLQAYSQVLCAFVADRKVTEEEEAQLATMRTQYGINKEQHEMVLYDIGSSPEDFEAMKDSAHKTKVDIVVDVLQNFLADKVISPQEHHQIKRLCNKLNVSDQEFDDCLRAVGYTSREYQAAIAKVDKMASVSASQSVSADSTPHDVHLHIYKAILRPFVTGEVRNKSRLKEIMKSRGIYGISDQEHNQVLTSLSSSGQAFGNLCAQLQERASVAVKITDVQEDLLGRLKMKKRAELKNEIAQDTQKEMHVKKRKIANLNVTLNAMKVKLEEKDAKIDQLQQQLDDKKSALKAMQEHVDSTERENGELINKTNHLTSEANDLKEYVDDMKKEHSKMLELTHDTLHENFAAQMQQLEARYQSHHDEHQRENSSPDIRSQKEDMYEKAAEAMKKKRLAEKKLESQERTIRSLEEANATLIEQRDGMSLQVATLTSRAQEAEHKVNNLTRQFADMELLYMNAEDSRKKILQQQKEASVKQITQETLMKLFRKLASYLVFKMYAKFYKAKKILAANIMRLVELGADVQCVQLDDLFHQQHSQALVHDSVVDPLDSVRVHQPKKLTEGSKAHKLYQTRRLPLKSILANLDQGVVSIRKQFQLMEKTINYWRNVANNFFQQNISLINSIMEDKVKYHAFLQHASETEEKELPLLNPLLKGGKISSKTSQRNTSLPKPTDSPQLQRTVSLSSPSVQPSPPPQSTKPVTSPHYQLTLSEKHHHLPETAPDSTSVEFDDSDQAKLQRLLQRNTKEYMHRNLRPYMSLFRHASHGHNQQHQRAGPQTARAHTRQGNTLPQLTK